MFWRRPCRARRARRWHAQSDRKKTPKSTQAARRGTDRKQDTAAQKQRGQAKKRSLTGKRRRTGTAVRRDPSPGSVSDAQPVSDSGQSDTTATWSDLDFDEEEDGFPASDLADVQARLATTGAHTVASGSSSSSSRPAVDAPPCAPPPAPAGGSRPGRILKRRGQAWGPFTISPIVRNQDEVVRGFGAICGLHLDRSLQGEDVTQTQCKRSFAIGSRTGHDCRVLLKRWLLRGRLQQHDWPAHRHRHTHVRMPASELQEGPSEEEMDAWMRNFMARSNSNRAVR